MNDFIMASKCSREMMSHASLNLNQNLEMIKLSEEGMSKVKIGRKLGLLSQRDSQVVNAKGKFSQKIASLNEW